jgi:O-antigen/teichoic acid export membrane protein
MPKLQGKINKNYYKEILSFSGWTLFGSSASLFSQQGLSITLNNFFGVLLNAANGVAQQIYTAVYQFVNSFQTAYSPYLMKTYAQEDYESVKKLIVFFSKLSIFLYLLVALPVFTFADFILQLWLVNVPEHAVMFTRLTLVIVFFEVLSAPLWLTVQASGNIKHYQIVISFILILNLPIAYFCFIVWQQPIFAFFAKIFTAILAYIYRVCSVRSLSCLNFKEYTRALVFRVFLLLLLIAPIIWNYINLKGQNVLGIALNVLVINSLLILCSVFVLLNRSEQKKFLNIIYSFLSRLKR